MFQREVAERIVASPAQRAAYGRPPKVTSALVELIPRAAPLPCEARLLSGVTQAAFGQRRKMLRQALKALAGGDAGSLLARANIDPTLRAEEIGMEKFVALARALGDLR